MMPLTHSISAPARSFSLRFLAACAVLIFAFHLPGNLGVGSFLETARADSETEGDTKEFEEEREVENDLDDEETPLRTSSGIAPRVTQELTGVYGRIGHIAFPTFGRRNSISNVELVPFVLDGNRMLFGDGRVFLDNEGQIGANGGIGFRRWVPAWNRVLGSSLWYDFDESTNNPFHQAGFSVESYGRVLDFRANGYLPVGDREQGDFSRQTNFRYVGNHLVFDTLRSFSESRSGFDVEMGLALPTQFAADHDLRVFGGYYHFLGDTGPDIDGVKGRVEGSITEMIDLQVEVTDDEAFGTNVSLGVAFDFGTGGTRSPRADEKLQQMTRYVNRNYNIIVTQTEDNSYHQPAINPATNQPYLIQHVSSAASGPGSGTQSDPFMSIAAAQTAGADLVLVHAGSELQAPVVLSANQRILGEGVDHLVSVQGVGNRLLPAFSGGTALPVLRNVSGDAVTLASGSEFSGFLIDGPSGRGIVGNGINGATVRSVRVQNAAGDGLFLANSTGPFLFDDVQLSGIGGTAFHVNGGDAGVTLNGSIDNSSGRAVVVENTTGGEVNLENADIRDDGGAGVLVAHNAGDVHFGNVDSRNSTTTGIDVQGGIGLTQFNNQTTVINSAGPAINVENTGGETHFNQVTVENATGAQGIRLVNSSEITTISNLGLTTENATALFVRDGGELGIFSGSIAATNGSAADIEDTTLGIDLTRVDSSNAVHGIRIIDSTGNFVVRGDGTAGSGGVIEGATVGVLTDNAEFVGLQSLTLDGNGTGLQASDTDAVVFYFGEVTNSANQGIDLLNVGQFELFGSSFEDNAGGSLRARFDAVGDYSYALTNNSFESETTSPVQITTLSGGEDSTLSLSVESNTINLSAANTQAVDLDWDGVLVSTFATNAITATGDSSTGFDINTASTSELAQIGIGQNSFTFEGDDSTGVLLTTAGSSEIAIGQNATTFDGASGVGTELSIGDSSTINIFANTVTDNVSRGTGLLFSSISGPSSVTINSNTINLLSPDSLIDRGIIFSSVTGDVQIMGNQNNVVTGATTPFSAVGTTGQILVNGVFVP